MDYAMLCMQNHPNSTLKTPTMPNTLKNVDSLKMLSDCQIEVQVLFVSGETPSALDGSILTLTDESTPPPKLACPFAST